MLEGDVRKGGEATDLAAWGRWALGRWVVFVALLVARERSGAGMGPRGAQT